MGFEDKAGGAGGAGGAGTKTRWIEVFGLFVMGTLYFVWPIPHVTTVREGAIIVSLLVFGYLVATSGLSYAAFKKTCAGFRLPVLICAVFTAWILVVALFISDDTAWSLWEIRGQWLKSFLTLATGVFAAVLMRKSGPLTQTVVVTLLFIVAMVHVLYVDLYGILMFFKNGELPSRLMGLTRGPDTANFVSIFALNILLVEFLLRVLYNRRFLPLNNVFLAAAFFLVYLSLYLETMRNGFVTSIILTFMAMGWCLYVKGGDTKKVVMTVVSLLVAVVILGYFGFRADPRWQSFIETIPIALDTENNRAWLDRNKYPYPRLASGKRVNPSNYERIAWFKEGAKLVVENPLGTGFGRQAYGRGIYKKYNEGRGHSHSGILDMAIGTGIPGVVLWLAFLLSLAVISLRMFSTGGGFPALLLFFVIVGYSLRMLVDSTLRDHVLQEFMFLVGLLSVMMSRNSEDEGKEAP